MDKAVLSRRALLAGGATVVGVAALGVGAAAPAEAATATVKKVVMFRVGRFRYNALTDSVSLHWPLGGDAGSHREIQKRITAVSGGLGVLTDTNYLANSTWHALGGAAMGTVCDLEGRVHGQRGLYVLDGALIPGTTGACNPSMTIAAVAERAMDAITAKDVGTVI